MVLFPQDHGLTWRIGLTWRAGPARMRRGTEATWQGRADGPREAQVARTHGRRPRGSTQTLVRGATWHEGGGWHLEGPRVSEPWLGVWGSNANALPRPKFYTHDFPFFYSVWDYVTRNLSSLWDYVPWNLPCRTLGSIASVSGDCRASIAWTLVHAIINQARALIGFK